MAAAERMSRVDTAWLRMDTEQNLMMIVGVWTLRPRLSLKDLRQMAVDAGGDPADIKGASKDELIEFLSDEDESEGDDDEIGRAHV